MKNALPLVDFSMMLYFLYIFLYCILFSLSFTVFYILRPYRFVDHNSSKVICDKNNIRYEIGPNLLFIFNDKFDAQTDKNVRKLCEYAIINDYQDTYKTPSSINYQLDLAYEIDGGWENVLLVSLSLFGFGFALIERFKKHFHHQTTPHLMLIGFGLGLVLFLSVFKNPSRILFCQRQQASTLANFKKSAYGFGLARIEQEEPVIQSVLKEGFQKCLHHGGVTDCRILN